MTSTNTFLSKTVLLFFFLNTSIAYSQIITTIVSGTNIGDGQSALNAGLSGPTGISFDPLGNSFIVDTDDARIRKINATGIITTLAGKGNAGFVGENIPATNAGFTVPRGITTDASGQVYIADSQNHRIRRIDLNGIITTVAGTGTQGFTGDGGPATSARLNFPNDVAIDNNGNLYITDSQNQRIRRINSNGIISTIAGNGNAGFSGDGGTAGNAQLNYPNAIAIDNTGNLYIAESQNNRVRKVDVNSTITTVTGNGTSQSSGDGGLAINAAVDRPVDIAVDAKGILYISQASSRIRKIGTDGIITTIVGNGTRGFSGDGAPAANALIGSSSGVDVDKSGNLYISDRENYRIRRITSDGLINTVAGEFTGDGGPATDAFVRKNDIFSSPSNLTVDKAGNLYVSDRFGNRIRKVDPSGIITTLAGTGIRGYTGDGGSATTARLLHPRGIGIDSIGNIYVVDQYNTRLRKIDINGVITTIAGNGTPGFIESRSFPSSGDVYNSNGMAVSKNGTVYIPTTTRILKITPSGIISTVAGTTAGTGYSGDGGLAIDAQISNPSSVALDKDGDLYIADSGNNRVRKVNANGIITTVAGNGTLGFSGENVQATTNSLVFPYEVTFDQTGTMYISESQYNRIRRVDRNGVMTTAVGDDLKNPNGITTDAAGNLYIADTGNQRVRKVTYPIQATLTINKPINCPPTSLTITAQPSGEGFTYQFSHGATQIGASNQAVVTTSGTYSVTVSTPVFGSPSGSASLNVLTGYIYTVKNGDWNDPTVWSCGVVPNATQQVQLLHAINLPLTYRASAQRIKYESGGSITMNAGTKVQMSFTP